MEPESTSIEDARPIADKTAIVQKAATAREATGTRGLATQGATDTRESTAREPSPLGATLSLGAQRYLIESRIGNGSTAETFRASSPSGDVAIKMLLPQAAADAIVEERFLREAHLLCRLSHPCIVQGFAHGEWRGRPYIVEELVTGRTLADMLPPSNADRDHATPLPAYHALGIAEDICSALVYLYFDGRVTAHRDIKPGNIMLTSNGRAKLIDLGIAKTPMHVLRDIDTGFLGSLRYVSPEQIDDASTVDMRTDIYALGAVLYEMLTGTRAYSGTTKHGIIDAHLSGAIPSLPSEGPLGDNPTLSAALDAMLHKALSADRLTRFQTPSEFLIAISNAKLTALEGMRHEGPSELSTANQPETLSAAAIVIERPRQRHVLRLLDFPVNLVALLAFSALINLAIPLPVG